ncbi:MAG: integrase arm-type DNA-binding domain-containing protein [Collimonas sp.]|uniref:tyrosine-type recombinase/integrase n=1 Tax=Collimonas sp. TaxID=1963772 RepID=UPI003263A384
MSLTDLKIRTLKPTDRAQKISDTEGLYLYVTPNGTKSWRFDYRFTGKRFTLTFGKYPEVSLADARGLRLEAKRKISAGINPSVEKKASKATLRATHQDTFKTISSAWFDSKVNLRSDSWRASNELYLRRDLVPLIGSAPIRTVDQHMLLGALEICKSERGVRTADRVRQTALQVFEYAIRKFKADINPAKLLNGWEEIPVRVNRPHLEEHQIHDFLDAVDAYAGMLTTKLAVKILALTFVRKNEIIDAVWDEFDIPNKKWIIPAERMKMKEAHVVPLCTHTLLALEQLRPLGCGSKYLFPSNSSLDKSISRTTLNVMFKRMGYGSKFSPHGIRATASTWLNEKGYRHDVIERQLAHSERNQIRASYNHADYLVERKQMMQVWGDFLFKNRYEDSQELKDLNGS